MVSSVEEAARPLRYPQAAFRAAPERAPRPLPALPWSSRGPSVSRVVGVAVVVALHVGIGYALVNGLARRTTEMVRPPIATRIIEAAAPEKAAPPPPPPRLAPPPPLFVPPPEIRIAKPPPPRPTAPATSITTAKPPPLPAPVAAPPAPPAPPAAPREPVRAQPSLDLAHSREPEYPPASRRAREQGSVLVKVLVGPDGRPLDAKVLESSGFSRLDEAAIRGIRSNYRFVPGTADGKPVEMWFTFKFTWRLK